MKFDFNQQKKKVRWFSLVEKKGGKEIPRVKDRQSGGSEEDFASATVVGEHINTHEIQVAGGGEAFLAGDRVAIANKVYTVEGDCTDEFVVFTAPIPLVPDGTVLSNEAELLEANARAKDVADYVYQLRWGSAPGKIDSSLNLEHVSKV